MEFEVASDTLHEFLHVERDTIISFLASCERREASDRAPARALCRATKADRLSFRPETP
jgi:hypothetical protein